MEYDPHGDDDMDEDEDDEDDEDGEMDYGDEDTEDTEESSDEAVDDIEAGELEVGLEDPPPNVWQDAIEQEDDQSDDDDQASDHDPGNAEGGILWQGSPSRNLAEEDLPLPGGEDDEDIEAGMWLHSWSTTY